MSSNVPGPEIRRVSNVTIANALFVKVRSATSGAAVNQLAARTLTLLAREL